MSLSLITSPPTKVFSKNPIIYKIQSTSYSGLDNYRVVIRVFFETILNSGTFTQIVEIEDTPDENGFTSWPIQAIIESAMMENTSLQVPVIDSNTPYLADNTRRFRIEYAEKYGQPAAIQSFTAASNVTAIHGGIDMHVFADTDYIAGITVANPFLTWMPDGQKVSLSQAAYLSWYNYKGSTVGLTLSWSAFSALGVVIQSGSYTNVSVDNGRTLVLPVGPKELGITNADAVKYRVTMIDTNDGDNSVAPAITYYIDRKPTHCERSILWFNSFNLPETLRLTGRTTISLNISRQNFHRTLPNDFNPLDGEILQHNADWSAGYIYRSGYLRKSDIDALQDMLIRNILFEITSDGYYRMHLTDKKYNITECLQFLHQLQFSGIRSIRPINFSRVAISSSSSGAFWVISNTGYYLTASGGRYELAQ